MKNFFSRLRPQEDRTRNVRINILGSALFKGINILANLAIIPVTISYVNPTQYGIWLTISSVVAWIGYFDLGLSLGFKNKFAEAKANDDAELAKQYVSTTYTVMLLLFSVLGIMAFVINRYIDWSSLLNISGEYGLELQKVFSVLTIYFCANMVLKIVCTMLDASQRNVITDFILTIGQVATLAVIYLMSLVGNGNLFELSLAYSATPLAVLAIASISVFSSVRYKKYAPSLNSVRLRLTKSILSLGFQFFIIMVSMLLIYQLMNVIIARNLGPDTVTQYNVAYKYFSILMMGMIIVLNPLWVAFTDAYTKLDRQWMTNALGKMEKLIPAVAATLLVMTVFSGVFFRLWIGDSVMIPLQTTVLIAMYTMAQVTANIYMYLINGIGKVRLQTIIYASFALVAVPVMDLSCKRFGLAGVLFLPTLVYLAQAILGGIQVRLLIKNSAKGIWNK